MQERLKRLRKLLSLSQKEFSEGIGVTQAAYSLMEKGQRPLTNRSIKAICSVYDVNEKWLLTGEEPIFANTQMKKELLDVFFSLSEPSQKYALKTLKELAELQKEENKL